MGASVSVSRTVRAGYHGYSNGLDIKDVKEQKDQVHEALAALT